LEGIFIGGENLAKDRKVSAHFDGPVEIVLQGNRFFFQGHTPKSIRPASTRTKASHLRIRPQYFVGRGDIVLFKKNIYKNEKAHYRFCSTCNNFGHSSICIGL
jgi:hypothetical protein